VRIQQGKRPHAPEGRRTVFIWNPVPLYFSQRQKSRRDPFQGDGRRAKRPIPIVLERTEGKGNNCSSQEGGEQHTDDGPNIVEDFPVAFRRHSIYANLANSLQRWKVEQESDVNKSIGSRCSGYTEGQARSEGEPFFQEEQTTKRERGEKALGVPGGHEDIGGCDAIEQAGEQSQASVLEDDPAQCVQGDHAQQEEGTVPQSHGHQQATPHTQPAAQGPQQRLCEASEDDGQEGEESKVVLVKVPSLGDEEEMLGIPVGEAPQQPLHCRVQVQRLLGPWGPERFSVVIRDDRVEDGLGEK